MTSVREYFAEHGSDYFVDVNHDVWAGSDCLLSLHHEIAEAAIAGNGYHRRPSGIDRYVSMFTHGPSVSLDGLLDAEIHEIAGILYASVAAGQSLRPLAFRPAP